MIRWAAHSHARPLHFCCPAVQLEHLSFPAGSSLAGVLQNSRTIMVVDDRLDCWSEESTKYVLQVGMQPCMWGSSVRWMAPRSCVCLPLPCRSTPRVACTTALASCKPIVHTLHALLCRLHHANTVVTLAHQQMDAFQPYLEAADAALGKSRGDMCNLELLATLIVDAKADLKQQMDKVC